MKKLFRVWILNSVSLWVIGSFLNGVSFENVSAIVGVGFAISILNVLVKPILKILAAPITFMTLGLFSFVINGTVLLLAFKMVDGGSIDSLGVALFASILLSLLNSFFEGVFRD